MTSDLLNARVQLRDDLASGNPPIQNGRPSFLLRHIRRTQEISRIQPGVNEMV